MRSRYQVDVQLVANILHRLPVEGHAHSSRAIELIIIPLSFLGVCPHQVAQEAIVRDILRLFRLAERLQTRNFLTDASVHTEYFFVN